MIGRFLGTDVPAAGFSIGFERIVDLVELQAEQAADAVALVYDVGVEPATLLSLKTELIAGGRRVRLERSTKNAKLLYEQLAAAGFRSVATVGPGTTTVDELSFRPLAARD
jgi:histidyl-tRNA synthetase